MCLIIYHKNFSLEFVYAVFVYSVDRNTIGASQTGFRLDDLSTADYGYFVNIKAAKFGLLLASLLASIQHYASIKEKFQEQNPSQFDHKVLDQEGIGQLLEIGIQRGRSIEPDLKVGICGEHGGESRSVEFCHRIGIDYVSCSPFRVPLGRSPSCFARFCRARC